MKEVIKNFTPRTEVILIIGIFVIAIWRISYLQNQINFLEENSRLSATLQDQTYKAIVSTEIAMESTNEAIIKEHEQKMQRTLEANDEINSEHTQSIIQLIYGGQDNFVTRFLSLEECKNTGGKNFFEKITADQLFNPDRLGWYDFDPSDFEEELSSKQLEEYVSKKYNQPASYNSYKKISTNPRAESMLIDAGENTYIFYAFYYLQNSDTHFFRIGGIFSYDEACWMYIKPGIELSDIFTKY